MTDELCVNRLTIIGSVKDLKKLDADDRWIRDIGGRHLELLEHSPRRRAWQFETLELPLERLRSLSVNWPRLTFILEYDQPVGRIKGLAKLNDREFEHYRVSY